MGNLHILRKIREGWGSFPLPPLKGQGVLGPYFFCTSSHFILGYESVVCVRRMDAQKKGKTKNVLPPHNSNSIYPEKLTSWILKDPGPAVKPFTSSPSPPSFAAAPLIPSWPGAPKPGGEGGYPSHPGGSVSSNPMKTFTDNFSSRHTHTNVCALRGAKAANLNRPELKFG